MTTAATDVTATNCAATMTVTVTETPAAATIHLPETSTVTITAATADTNGANLQASTGALGGVSTLADSEDATSKLRITPTSSTSTLP